MSTRYLPRLGDTVRDRASGTVGRVVRLLADSGGGEWLVDITPAVSRRDTLRGEPPARAVRCALADVEALH